MAAIYEYRKLSAQNGRECIGEQLRRVLLNETTVFLELRAEDKEGLVSTKTNLMYRF